MTRLLFAICAMLFSAAQAEACLPADIRAQLSRMSHCGIKIGSTFRRGAVIAGTGHPSYHASCRAVDFHARDRGCAMRALAGWHGGVITYSGGHNHIHIDNGPRLRAHNGGGRVYAKRRGRAVYASARKRGGKRYQRRAVAAQPRSGPFIFWTP